jgi:DNA-directed RNA polymerase subunit RPC12/RpoP
MAGAAPIKFRCTQCGRLLGASRSKAGAAVACPKCGMTLFVPEPSEPSTPPPLPKTPEFERGDTTGPRPTSPTAPTALDSGIPLDFLDIRPEDIRVEPAVRDLPLNIFPPVDATSSTEPGEPSDAETDTEPDREPEPEAETGVLPIRIETEPEPVRSGGSEATVVPPPLTENPAVSGAVLPPIRLETPAPGVRAGRALLARPHDLVLPRSVVMAWSLFVLLALALAFAAGLLAGHYVWRGQ